MLYTQVNPPYYKRKYDLKIKFECTRLSPSNVVSGIQFQIYVAKMPSGIKISLDEQK